MRARPRRRTPGQLAPIVLLAGLPGLAAADDDAPRQTVRRAHEVSTLLEPLEEQHAPRLGLVTGWSLQGSSNDGDGGVLTFEDGEQSGPWFSWDELQRWVGGMEHQGGELRQGRLIFELTPAAHERVAAGLRLARAEARPVAALTIEVVALAPEQERALAAGAGAPLDAEALQALTQARAAGGRLASCQLLVRDGERVAKAQLEMSTFLGDREVNQTGIIPVLNPVVEELASGCSVEVSANRLPGEEGRLLLDVRLERSEREPLLREVNLRQAGKLQLPAISHLGLAVTAAGRTGETVLLGAARVPGADARLAQRTLAVTCRLEAVPGPAVPAPPAGAYLRRYSLRAALPAPEVGFPRPGWPASAGVQSIEPGCFIMEESEAAPGDSWSPSQLADQVMSEAAQGSWEDPDSGCWVEARGQALIVSQTTDGQAAVEAFLRGQSAASQRVQHELLVLAAPEPQEGAPPLAHVLDAAAWDALVRKLPVQERLLLAGQDGQRVEGVLRRELRMLAAVESSAGGETPESAKVAEDPLVATLTGGTQVSLRARLGPDGEVSLELDADLRQCGTLEQLEIPEGSVDRVVGGRSAQVRQRALLGPGQGLAWELGTGAERRLLLVRARPLSAAPR